MEKVKFHCFLLGNHLFLYQNYYSLLMFHKVPSWSQSLLFIQKWCITAGLFSRENGISTTTNFTVQGLPCESIPLGLKMTVPAHGFVRTPMVISYHLINNSQELINLDVAMESSESFMFSGYKEVGNIFFIV